MELTPLAARSFAAILEDHSGQQLTGGRRWRLETTLAPILRQHNLASFDRLAIAAHGAGEEAGALRTAVAEALLNHETSFFRDRAMFEALRAYVLPRLAAQRANERRLRIWSAGCSTGQEAHSLAMLLEEDAAAWTDWSVQIVATDVSAAAIARAREALYPRRETQRGLTVGELLRFMVPEGDDWRLRPDLAARTRFHVASLLDPPPPGPFDLILCRNVLLYFDETRRRRAFARLAEALAPDGLLLLGAGETALGQTDLICPEPSLRGCYRHAPRGAGAEGSGPAMRGAHDRPLSRLPVAQP